MRRSGTKPQRASALQGCLGAGTSSACGPEVRAGRKLEVLALFYGGWGSAPFDGPTATVGNGGPDGLGAKSGDGHPGESGSAGGSGKVGGIGSVGAYEPVSSEGYPWTPGNGGRLPVRSCIARDSSRIACWPLVTAYRLHIRAPPVQHIVAVVFLLIVRPPWSATSAWEVDTACQRIRREPSECLA